MSGKSIAALSGLALVCGLVSVAVDRTRSSHTGSAVAERMGVQTEADVTHRQRRQAWAVFLDLTQAAPSADDLVNRWRRAEDLFTESPRTQVAMSHAGISQSAEPQVIISTLFNEAAARHISGHQLQSAAELMRLQSSGEPDPVIADNRTVPAFPDGSVVLLTAWWPIAAAGVTAMPVWDPELNPPLRGGNSYITWTRSVAVDPDMHESSPKVAAIVFAGRELPDARRISLETMPHVSVDRELADGLSRVPMSRKAAVIALGRPLEAGDALALVAVHVAAKENGRWIWLTLWWHDQADRGPYSQDRPAAIAGAWRNFLLDTPLDLRTAHREAGDADVCFNPWLEARFPDDGLGGGTSSHCVACHERASYPAVSFLPLTRGTADVANDPAFAPGRLRTDMLWSIARRTSP